MPVRSRLGLRTAKAGQRARCRTRLFVFATNTTRKNTVPVHATGSVRAGITQKRSQVGDCLRSAGSAGHEGALLRAHGLRVLLPHEAAELHAPQPEAFDAVEAVTRASVRGPLGHVASRGSTLHLPKAEARLA